MLNSQTLHHVRVLLRNFLLSQKWPEFGMSLLRGPTSNLPGWIGSGLRSCIEKVKIKSKQSALIKKDTDLDVFPFQDGVPNQTKSA